GRLIRFHLSLGSRYSPKYVRIYDKGLEQGSREAGRHERLEVEFKKDHAIAVDRAILEAGTDRPIALARLIFGSFDFRVRNGRSELKRRPRAAWFESMLAGLEPVPMKKQAVTSSFDTWHSGLARSYLPQLLALSNAIGVSLGSLVEALATNVTPSGNVAKTAELLAGLQDQPEVVEQAKRA
ncbi:MAG: replication initiation factor domain-containing protein, partial [Planctomycetota bacterium]